jgi:uncharacterized damage-inducible protein DinB
MSTTNESAAAVVTSAKDQFLATYQKEHDTTMRVLRAFPVGKLDLKPTPVMKSARELAWIFVQERGLGTAVWQDAFARGLPPAGPPPTVPESWDELLAALEGAHEEFKKVVANTSDEDLDKTVKFLVGPKNLGDFKRIDFAWFLLFDQIHHRGQFSVYVRMAGGQVPSIYGPTLEQPWL